MIQIQRRPPQDLRALLGAYAKSLLSKVAKRWGYSPRMTKPRLVEALASALNDAQRLSRVATELSDAQRRALAMVAAGELTRRWPLRTVTARVLHEGHPDAPEQVYELVLSGLLLLAPGRHADKISANPDLALSACPVCLPDALVQQPRPDRQPLVLESASPQTLETLHLADPGLLPGALARLLHLTRERQIRLTQAGFVAKNQHKVIERALGSEAPAGFVLNLGRGAGLFDTSGDHIVAAAPGRWPEAGVPLTRRLLEAYCREEKTIELLSDSDDWTLEQLSPTIAAGIGSVRMALLTALARLPGGTWVVLDQLASHLREVDPGIGHVLMYKTFTNDPRRYGYGHHVAEEVSIAGEPIDPDVRVDQARSMYAAATLGLRLLGLVDLGRRPGAMEIEPGRPVVPVRWEELDLQPGGRPRRRNKQRHPMAVETGLTVRLSALGAATLRGAPPPDACEFVVGADFEVLAPLDRAPYDVLGRLAQVTAPEEGHSADPVRRLRLTREALQGGLMLVPLERVVEDLGRASGGVPQNVEATLRDWSRQLTRVQAYLGWDLLELSDRAARDAALARTPGAVAVGDRFMLSDPGDAPSPAEDPADGDGVTIIDYTKAAAPCLEVTPDLEITIDETHSDLFITRQLDRLAAPVPGDGPRRYRLDRDRVLASGCDADHLLELLERSCAGPLPNLVQVCVEVWTGEEPGLALEQVSVLRTPDGAAGALAAHPELAPCLRGALGRDLLVVDPRRLEELNQVLSRLGLTPGDSLPLRPTRQVAAEDVPFDEGFHEFVEATIGRGPMNSLLGEGWGGDDGWDDEGWEDDEDDEEEGVSVLGTTVLAQLLGQLDGARSVSEARATINILDDMISHGLLVEVAVDSRTRPIRGQLTDAGFDSKTADGFIKILDALTGKDVTVPSSDILAVRLLMD